MYIFYNYTDGDIIHYMYILSPIQCTCTLYVFYHSWMDMMINLISIYSSIIYIYAGWWFGTFFIFHNIYNPSHWLSYFSRWLTPPTSIYIYIYIHIRIIFHILGIIIPTDFHIFQRGRSTTNQIYSFLFYIYIYISVLFILSSSYPYIP